MVVYKLYVEPTMNMGSYTSIVRDSDNETYRQDALWQYNSAREHDGLPPLKSMPNGTHYTKLLQSIPKGYRKTQGATTTLVGYSWYSNGESRFSGKRKSVLVKDR